MPNLSDHLDCGENYSREDLCKIMQIKYVKNEIEVGIYKPRRHSSILFFSTIENHPSYVGYPSYINQPKFINGKISDTEFIFSANNQNLDQDITLHKITHKELLLFVRKDDTTNFYYFGQCRYLRPHELPNYPFPLYCLELLDTKFSNVRGVEIPDLSN